MPALTIDIADIDHLPTQVGINGAIGGGSSSSDDLFEMLVAIAAIMASNG